MKKRTRVVAWFYILLQLPAILAVALFAFAGGSLVAVPEAWRSSAPESLLTTRLVGSGVIVLTLLMALVVLLHVWPWISLLRRKAWAWWLLTILYTGGIALWLTETLTPIVQEHVQPASAFAGTWPLLILFGPTLLILLTDRPSMWKRRRGPTSRHRKRPSSYRSRRH